MEMQRILNNMRLKHLYKKFRNIYLLEYYKERNRELANEFGLLERDAVRNQAVISVLIELGAGVRLLGFTTSNQNKKVYGDNYYDHIVFQPNMHSEDIRIVDVYGNRVLDMFVTVRSQAMLVDDIQITDICQGFGTVALECLVGVAEKKGIKKIHGVLSETDFDHIERLTHFYQKNGFEVKIKGKSGTVVMDL